MSLRKAKEQLLKKIIGLIFGQKELRLSPLGHRVIKLSRKNRNIFICVWLGVTLIISLGTMFGSAYYLVQTEFCNYEPLPYDLIDCPWKYYPLDLLLVEIGPLVFIGLSGWYLTNKLGVFFREKSNFEKNNQSEFVDRVKKYYQESGSHQADEKDHQ